MSEHAAPAPAARLPGWLVRPWRAMRKDIGRKLTALGCALLLWGLLENLVVGENRVELDVRHAFTREEADKARVNSAAVYLVVPGDLTVREVSKYKVGLHVKGMKDDVANLDMSAVVAFQSEMLGTADEMVFNVPLERDAFKSRGDPPQLTYFRVSPDSLKVTLARSATAELTLSWLNVTTSGKPRDGFTFQESRSAVRPGNVTVSGPRAAVERLRAENGQPRLTPVNIDGLSTTVTQHVGLPQDLIDAGVMLHTPSGVVEVTVFLVPEDKTVEVFDVPVTYFHEELLAQRKLRVEQTTESFDLKVIGPRLELDEFTPDQLRQRILLKYDWSDDNQIEGRPRPDVFLSGLSDAVKVLDVVNDEEPRIWFKLEPIPEPK